MAHPDSPAGGCGPGYSQRWGPETGYVTPLVANHPRAPQARQSDWASDSASDHLRQRAYAVYLATRGALNRVGGAIVDATGAELHEMLAGLLPGLIMAIVIPAITTAVGAAAGTVVGFFAGGVGAAPGAAAGAGLGLEAGVFILEWLGIGFLVAYIGKSLATGVAMGSKATLRAWGAVNHQGELRHTEITAAAIDLANAVAEVFRGILQGVVAFLLAKGTAAVAARVPEVVAKLKSSRLGAGFAEWIERNWQSLITNPKLSDAPTNVRATGARPAAPAVTPSRLLDSAQNQPLQTPRATSAITKRSTPSPSRAADFTLDATTIERIRNIPKGSRPNPDTYLPREAIEAHLEKFDGGASRLMSKANLEKYGPAQRDGTSFVMPKDQTDALIKSTAGDARAMERALGLPDGFLNSNELVRVDIENPRSLGLRVPSGNEAGANEFWIPGGKLPTGNLEAVIDFSGSPTEFVASPMKF